MLTGLVGMSISSSIKHGAKCNVKMLTVNEVTLSAGSLPKAVIRECELDPLRLLC